MKQKHIFLITIDHYEDENRIFTKVVQGPIKRDFETNYVVDDSGNDYWVSKKIFESGLCLPSDTNLTEEELFEICKQIKSAFKG